MELHNNRDGDFCKRIKSQQSDPAKKIDFKFKTNQILTNDDQMLILCLSFLITTVILIISF